jgi:hypothetical protein
MMKSPTVRILAPIGILLAAIEAGAFVGLYPSGNSLLVVLGGLIGPYMGLSYPWQLKFRIGYIILLIFSLGVFVFGLSKRETVIGQSFAVVRIISWLFAGIIGLGTGT